MLRVAVAAAEPTASAVAAEIEFAAMHVRGLFSVAALHSAVLAESGLQAGERAESEAAEVWALLDGADVLVVESAPGLLGRELLAACDRRGIRIIALTESDEQRRFAHSLGLTHTASAAAPRSVVVAITGQSAAPDATSPLDVPMSARVFTVWGPGGSPGRSTIAIELAYELARGGRSVLLIDADTQGAALALALGVVDEGPGFAAACRQAGIGVLDADEIHRISVPIAHAEGSLRLLTGINRPARWPELTEERVGAAIRACRDWVDFVVVDVAAPLERDEEIVSDLDGLRRHAAGFGALRAADVVVAVASIEPVAMARFVRGHAELRAVVGSTPIAVVANRLRPGALGVDARGQVRAALARFAGTSAVSFVPLDPRSADAAMLAAAPIGATAPKSPLVAAVRRLVGEVLGAAGGSGDTDLAHGAAPASRPLVRRRGRRAALRHTESGVAAT